MLLSCIINDLFINVRYISLVLAYSVINLEFLGWSGFSSGVVDLEKPETKKLAFAALSLILEYLRSKSNNCLDLE